MTVVQMSSLNNFLQLLGVTALFIFILVITFLTTKFVGGVKINKDKRSNFKAIETYKIAPNKFIQIIQIGSRYFVISISKDSIQYIAELGEDDVKEPELLKMDIHFSDILNKITKNQKGKDGQNSDH